ncbi:NAD(P)-binding protein [Xylaria intraflava]|nr:NAD(P)-binding protein [Xylaria intraflava]
MNRSLIRSFTTQILPLPYPTADFTGKTVIVTGANSGVGLEAARHFVRLNAQKVILACRDLAKAESAREDIVSSERNACDIELWEVDLGSFESVKAFCRRAAELERLDVVIENAGLLSHQYMQFEEYERQCTVNIISTWLMALLLLPVLRRPKPSSDGGDREWAIPHLCIVGSNAQFYTEFHQRSEASIFEAFKGGDDMYHRYANTKLCSLLIMREVASRMKGDGKPRVVLNMVEPGFCRTNLLREGTWAWYFVALMAVSNALLGRTPEMGARNYIWAACAGPESHGAYLEDCGLSTPCPFADTDEGKRLQTRVFGELAGILEGIAPSIMQNI